MATASDIITGSLKILGAIQSGESTASAEESADALTMLNDLMHAFPTFGIDYTHSTLASAGVIALDDKHIRGLKHMLAKELAPSYGKALTPEEADIAEECKRQLQADFPPTVAEGNIDTALTTMPSQYWGTRGLMT